MDWTSNENKTRIEIENSKLTNSREIGLAQNIDRIVTTLPDAKNFDGKKFSR